MPYECLMCIKHDGRRFEIGEKIPDDMISKAQGKQLVEIGAAKHIKTRISAKERRDIERKEDLSAKIVDLQSLVVEEILDLVNAEESVATVYKWQLQEEAGKNRKTVMRAIERRISVLETS